jgi:hypothetical protein
VLVLQAGIEGLIPSLGTILKEFIMFMQMKSRSQYVKSKSCNCENKCPCHAPRKKDWKYKLEIVILVVGGFSILPALVIFNIWYQKKHPPLVRYIEVNGQMCEIKYKETHRSSTGAPRGHDIAVCK